MYNVLKIMPFIIMLSFLIGCGAGSDANNMGPSEDPITEDSNSGADSNINADAVADLDTGTDTEQGLTYFGFVSVSDSINDDHVSMDAEFTRVETPIPIKEIQFFEDKLTPIPDTCRTGGSSITAQATFPLPETIESNISAGETITFTYDSGTYAELTREIDEEGGYYYRFPNQDLPRHSPNGLSVSIPGDIFPAYQDINLPDIAPFELLSPTVDDGVDNSSIFQWTGTDREDGFVYIIVVSQAHGIISCVSSDTGSFQIPGDFLAEIGEPIESLTHAAFRAKYQTIKRGRSILILSRISAN